MMQTGIPAMLILAEQVHMLRNLQVLFCQDDFLSYGNSDLRLSDDCTEHRRISGRVLAFLK